jgi:hypothetical protein
LDEPTSLRNERRWTSKGNPRLRHPLIKRK